MSAPVIGIIMGSGSDWPTMRAAALVLEYATGAQSRGLRCLIAGAGGAAHLPGMVAALTLLPVLGVPVRSRALNGLDSLLSIVQMPAGIPVATFRVGEEGAADAAHFAVRLPGICG